MQIVFFCFRHLSRWPCSLGHCLLFMSSTVIFRIEDFNTELHVSWILIVSPNTVADRYMQTRVYRLYYYMYISHCD